MERKKILICDDDEGILDMLEIILDDAGFDVYPEQNSLNVMETICGCRPHVMLLDLWMPMLSGDQVLMAVRENAATTNLPVIVISASPEGKTIALAAGASAFLAKPFDIDMLTSLIEKLMLD